MRTKKIAESFDRVIGSELQKKYTFTLLTKLEVKKLVKRTKQESIVIKKNLIGFEKNNMAIIQYNPITELYHCLVKGDSRMFYYLINKL